MPVPEISWNVTRGDYFQRVIAPRDARTHWPAPSTTATAFISDVNGASASVPTYIQSDGSILLVMDESSTTALSNGEYYFEVSANPSLPYYNLGGLVSPYPPRTQRVAVGTLTVTSLDYTNFLSPAGVGETASSGNAPTISQGANVLNLEWTEGDAISLAFTAVNVNWAGTYAAQVRTARSISATLMGSFTVTATFSGTNTAFTLVMSQANSALIPAGGYYWDLQQVGGVTRLTGVVTVDQQVTS